MNVENYISEKNDIDNTKNTRSNSSITIEKVDENDKNDKISNRLRSVVKNFNNKINECNQKKDDATMNEIESNNIIENVNIKTEQLSEDELMFKTTNRDKINLNCGKTKKRNSRSSSSSNSDKSDIYSNYEFYFENDKFT